MASMRIKGMTEFETMLTRLGDASDATARQALYKAAGIVADAVRQNLENLVEELPVHSGDRYRYLQPDQMYTGVPSQEKQDLLAGLGITPIDVDDHGVYNVKIGFEADTGNERGYDSQPTEKYPKGRPLMMLARSIESGSSVRPKQPFFRPAVNAVKNQAVEAMKKTITDAAEKIVK